MPVLIEQEIRHCGRECDKCSLLQVSQAEAEFLAGRRHGRVHRGAGANEPVLQPPLT